MKNTVYSSILLLLIIGLLTFSCTQSNTTNHLHDPIPTPVRQHSDGITLDGDNLWKANTATTTGVENMRKILTNFKHTEDVAAFKDLHKTLEDEIVTIFTKCNMKGEGHDQLHNFLLPLHENLEPLKSGDLPTCQSTFITLRKQLAIYPLYFK